MQYKERRDHKKKLIKDAALELFATKGYENTKVSDIVKHIQSSQGTFYWYFTSKEECALEMLEEGRQHLLEFIKLGYRAEIFEVHEAVLSTKSIFHQIFHFAQENTFLMQIILRGIHSQQLLQQKVNEIKCDMETAFSNNIIRAKELGVLRTDIDEKFYAVLIMSLLEGVLARWLFNHHEEYTSFENRTLEEIIEQTVLFEFYGLFGQR